MANERIKLTRYEATNVNVHYLSAYRLKIVASDAEGLDNRVFLFRRDSINPYTGVALDTFLTVCSAVDMEDYPPAEPNPEKLYPFFRSDTIELDLRSTSIAEDIWSLIKQEVCILLEAIDRLAVLKVKEESWCGIPPETGSASSSSSESS